MEDCDQKPGSRLSHFRYKFGIQTSKSLHYCSICATNKDSYCFEYQQYGNQPIQYSINKKSRFQIVRSLCAEMQRQRKKRKQELKQKNRKDVSFKGNCASFAAAKYCKRPKLPKMYSANRPKIVTRPTLFPIRISKTSLDKVIEGTFEDLQPIYSKDKYQDDDVLCYLLANQHACSHQVKQTCQDCNGWYIAYTQLGGGEVSYRGTSVDNKNRGRYATVQENDSIH